MRVSRAAHHPSLHIPKGVNPKSLGDHQSAYDWLKSFAVFVGYAHKVRAMLPNGRLAPLPINIDTINIVFGTKLETAAQVASHLARIASPISKPANAAAALGCTPGLTQTLRASVLSSTYREFTCLQLAQEGHAISKWGFAGHPVCSLTRRQRCHRDSASGCGYRL